MVCIHQTTDDRYPDKMPVGTEFLPFAKPGKIKDNMTEWEKKKEDLKTERAKRWIHACGRKDFNSIEQINKYVFICTLHFLPPILKDSDPIIASSSTTRKQTQKRQPPKEREFKSGDDSDEGEAEVGDEKVYEEGVPSDITLLYGENTKATQTASLDKLVLGAKLENTILRHSMLATNESGGIKRKRRDANRMSFKVIYAERKTFKHFIGLYPEEFDALYAFLGPAKDHLNYWNSGTGNNLIHIQKFTVQEQLFITLLRLRRGYQLEDLAYFYNVSEF